MVTQDHIYPAHKLQGRVAIVTGGGSGIGRASAKAFARGGCSVVIADIDPEGGEETKRLIEADNGTACFFHVDVADTNGVEAMVRETIATFGRLDYAHNNAGILPTTARTHEHPEDDWDRTIAVNLKGVWLCMKYEIGAMLKGYGGSIVNTASVAGLEGNAGLGAYTASKHGIVGITKVAAQEYVREGIRVNAICPGSTRTRMVERFFERTVKQSTMTMEEIEAMFTSGLPIGRLARPEEVAAAAVWLCSDEASFVTGAALPVDGGVVAGVIMPSAWGRTS